MRVTARLRRRWDRELMIQKALGTSKEFAVEVTKKKWGMTYAITTVRALHVHHAVNIVGRRNPNAVFIRSRDKQDYWSKVDIALDKSRGWLKGAAVRSDSDCLWDWVKDDTDLEEL